MPLLTAPSGSSLTAEQLLLAETLVAVHLGGTTLTAHEVSESGTVGSSGLIALRDGPCTAISSLTLNGAPAAGVAEGGWAVNVGQLMAATGLSWAYGGVRLAYTITYTAGWAEGALPEPIRQAVLATAAAIEARPDPSLKSESEGPVSRSWDTSTVLPTSAGLLLERWRAVRF